MSFLKRRWIIRLGFAVGLLLLLIVLGSSGSTWVPTAQAYSLPSWCPSVPTVPTIPTVPTVPTFPDVPPTFWAYEYIEVLAHYGYVIGHPDGTYGPVDPVTRAQMAVFLERANRGPSFVPTLPSVPPFSDVPLSFWAVSWISALKDDGLTIGYPDGTYRPLTLLNRAQTAVFFTRLHRGPSFTPTVPTVSSFPDVPLDFWALPWIEQVLADELVNGFPDGTYRPLNDLTRAQMAALIVRALCLPGFP